MIEVVIRCGFNLISILQPVELHFFLSLRGLCKVESGPLALMRAEHVTLIKKVKLCPLGRVHYFLVLSISNPLAPNLFIFWPPG